MSVILPADTQKTNIAYASFWSGAAAGIAANIMAVTGLASAAVAASPIVAVPLFATAVYLGGCAIASNLISIKRAAFEAKDVQSIVHKDISRRASTGLAQLGIAGKYVGMGSLWSSGLTLAAVVPVLGYLFISKKPLVNIAS